MGFRTTWPSNQKADVMITLLGHILALIGVR